MKQATTIQELRRIIHVWRLAGERVAFVPTMGNLHRGHLQLVEQAKKQADRVVVSIFVNPTQFGEGEDFDSYPRTLPQDILKLEPHQVDTLFLPSVAELYGKNTLTTVSVQGLSSMHCGASRKGHFNGVATVVSKLFNIVQPDVALFGEKDFQQLAVIREMVCDLNMPIEILGVATVRESDGLAMSSRSGYLNTEQRKTVTKLYETLCAAKQAVIAGLLEYARIEKNACAALTEVGFEPEYFSICKADNLNPATSEDTCLVILAAAKIGQTRLIDNISFSK